MDLIAVVASLFFIALLIFYAFAFPIWMIIHAGMSERSSGAKTGWILATVITWTLGAVVYGLFAAREIYIKVLSGLGALGMIAFIGIAFVSMQMVMPLIAEAPEQIAKELSTVNHPELSVEEMQLLQDNVASLVRETPQSFAGIMENPTQFQVHVELIKRLSDSTDDGELTKQEYQDWITLYEARGSLDPDRMTNE
jgi:hypothetical protein